MKTKPFSYPKIDLSGQVALVTGAAKGLGRAISLGFAEMGARLILVDIDREEHGKGLCRSEGDGEPQRSSPMWQTCVRSKRFVP